MPPCALTTARSCFTVAAFLLMVCEGQVFEVSRPVLSPPLKVCFKPNPKHGRVVKFVSDQQTKCQYWVCVPGRMIPATCGLQTYISEFYEGDNYNPCTESYASTAQFDCTRKGFDPDGTPSCIRIYNEQNVCKNGGSVLSQGNLCWCKCAPGFTGFSCAEIGQDRGFVVAEKINEDASQLNAPFIDGPPPSVIIAENARVMARQLGSNGASANVPAPAPPARLVPSSMDKDVKIRVDASGRFVSDDPCPGGFQRDFCLEQGGCLNNGTCVNQCLGMICLCKPPFTAGRRCEKYRCQVNVECMNNGICKRGPDGADPVATCTCLPGFRGPMCEIKDNE